METKNSVYKVGGNQRIALSRAVRQFSDVLSENCEDIIYRVMIYTDIESEEEVERNGLTVHIKCGLSNEEGTLLGLELLINTNENELCAPTKFKTMGNRDACLNRIRDSLYRLIDSLDVFDMSISTLSFDVSDSPFKSICYTMSVNEPGCVDLNFAYYDRDYVGISDLNNFFRKG